MHTIQIKLNLSPQQINALFTHSLVAGWTGEQVRLLLAERYAINADGRLGEQLEERGLLTWAEARWLDT